MNYDPARHITHEMLADAAGITSLGLINCVKNGKCPPPVGKAPSRQRIPVSFYDRTEALLWAVQMRPQATGEIVPPSDINLMKRETWKPKGRLADNFARASEVYPHRLYTPDGVGNGTERAHGFGRGA